MTYDDGLVTAVWASIYDRLLAMKDADITAGLGFQLQDGDEPGHAVARAAIAAVLEWQGKGTAADELRRAMEILNSPTPPATVEALRERLNRGLR